jgi:hypothetical protein
MLIRDSHARMLKATRSALRALIDRDVCITIRSEILSPLRAETAGPTVRGWSLAARVRFAALYPFGPFSSRSTHRRNPSDVIFSRLIKPSQWKASIARLKSQRVAHFGIELLGVPIDSCHKTPPQRNGSC